jgi:hypothetical protein
MSNVRKWNVVKIRAVRAEGMNCYPKFRGAIRMPNWVMPSSVIGTSSRGVNTHARARAIRPSKTGALPAGSCSKLQLPCLSD